MQRRAADVDEDEEDRRELERPPQLPIDLEVALEVGRRPRPLDRERRRRRRSVLVWLGCLLTRPSLSDRAPALDGLVGGDEPLFEEAGLVGLDLLLGLLVLPLWPARDRERLLHRQRRLQQLEREVGRVGRDWTRQRVRQSRRLGAGNVLGESRQAEVGQGGQSHLTSGRSCCGRVLRALELLDGLRASKAGTWTRACASRPSLRQSPGRNDPGRRPAHGSSASSCQRP